MSQKKRKQLLSISIITLIATIVIISANCKLSFAEIIKKGDKTIEIGAKNKPEIQISGEFKGFKNTFADVAEKVIPTVVTITTTNIDTIVYTNPFDYFFGSPFDQFFGFPNGRHKIPQQKKELRRSGVGSGVIVSKNGYIITNYHVVGNADEITVETYDDRVFEAEIVGSDSLSDVAVIKIKDNVNDLPAAYLGNSDKLRQGDWVIAIGNPFNLTSTVTVGIVSALGRHTGGISMYQNFIQTDAAINPGNSGGALVNIEGEVIGINTMIYTRSGGYMGIGFAIPINMAKRIMKQLITKGKVERGWLGVQISDIDYATRQALGLKRKGVLINDVFKNQPAEKAGIKAGDVILSIDNVPTKDANTLRNMVASIEPGKEVPIEIFREGKIIKLKVKLSLRDEEKIKKMASAVTDENIDVKEEKVDLKKKVGFSVSNITNELREQLGISKSIKGVIVTEIDQTSKAAMKGLKVNDIILKIKVSGKNFIKTTNTEIFKNAVKNVKKGDSILLYVKRGNTLFFIAFKITK